METKEFKIIEVKEITAKNGNKFTAYKTIGKGGRKLDVRFTRKVPDTDLPTEPCIIVVKEEEANMDTTRQYPILWVKGIVEKKPLERKNNLDQFFD